MLFFWVLSICVCILYHYYTVQACICSYHEQIVCLFTRQQQYFSTECSDISQYNRPSVIWLLVKRSLSSLFLGQEQRKTRQTDSQGLPGLSTNLLTKIWRKIIPVNRKFVSLTFKPWKFRERLTIWGATLTKLLSLDSCLQNVRGFWNNYMQQCSIPSLPVKHSPSCG